MRHLHPRFHRRPSAGEYNSLETQRDICQHAIAVHQHEGWIATHFIDDPGFSGKNLERPGMQSLLRED